jgi:uncharacterized protein DUF4256
MRATRARNISSNKNDVSPDEREELLRALKTRFQKNMNRHKLLEWGQVQAKLEAHAEKLWSSRVARVRYFDTKTSSWVKTPLISENSAAASFCR